MASARTVQSLPAVALLILSLAACGDDGGGGGGDGDGGPGGGDGGGGCQNAQECSGDEVCNPETGQCESGVDCDEHSDCGTGGHCVGGVCEPNETGGTCDDDVNCPGTEICIEGFCGCEGEAFAAEPIIPNIMIVYDKSGSMEEDLDGDCPLFDDGTTTCDRPPHAAGSDPNPAFDAPDKWTVAGDAMTQILTSHGAQVRFGLVTFSSDNDCGGGNIRVAIANDTEDDIQSTLDMTSPRGATPIGDTLDDLVGENSLADTTRPNYVLLITDGQETCGGDGVQAAGDLFDQTPSVKTFVVGFGGGVDPGELNDIAVAGHTDRAGATKYYQADNASELADALDTILGSVLSCSYQLDQVPEDLADLYVYADGNPVDRDQTQSEGWDYDAGTGTLTFYGQICADLQDGTITDVAFIYGCPNSPVE